MQIHVFTEYCLTENHVCIKPRLLTSFSWHMQHCSFAARIYHVSWAFLDLHVDVLVLGVLDLLSIVHADVLNLVDSFSDGKCWWEVAVRVLQRWNKDAPVDEPYVHVLKKISLRVR